MSGGQNLIDDLAKAKCGAVGHLANHLQFTIYQSADDTNRALSSKTKIKYKFTNTKIQMHKYTYTNSQKHKYTNTAYDKMTEIPNICYIFE